MAASRASRGIAVDLNDLFPSLSLPERLRLLRQAMTGRIVFTTSFGLEDQVLAHALGAAGLDIDWVTLDTGRLFPETYGVWAETELRYDRRITAISPDSGALRALVARQGINGFYGSAEARKACCAVRKVAPLGAALDGATAWITGLRAEQSAERRTLDIVTFDEERGLVKANPLFDWTREQALSYAREHSVPINSLHAKGFLSIGCAPCTRAVNPGETERAGRWWWEQETKECGLHVATDGRLVRAAHAEASGEPA